MGNTGFNPLAKKMAESISDSVLARMNELAESKVSAEILGVDKEVQTTIFNRMADLRMAGVDRVSFFKPRDSGLLPTSKIETATNAIFRKVGIDAKTGMPKEKFIKTGYYNPELDAFITREQADQLTNAADLGYTTGQISAEARKLSTRRIINNFAEDTFGGRTGDVEASWLKNLEYYSKRTGKELAEVEIIAGDLPAQYGWIQAVEQRINSVNQKLQDPNLDFKDLKGLSEEVALLRNAKVKVFSEDRIKPIELEEVPDMHVPYTFTSSNDYVKPTHVEDISRDIDSGAIQPLIKASFGSATSITRDFHTFAFEKAGLSTMSSLNEIAPAALEKYAREFAQLNYTRINATLTEPGSLSPEAGLFLLRWINGGTEDKEMFRNAMASARTLRAGQHSTTPFANQLTEILGSQQVKNQIAAIKKHGDAKGNVYLYRGMTQKAAGDTPVSSYTFDRGKASIFGQVSMYKVHADDVVGYLYAGEKEWLVGATARDVVDNVPTQSAAQKTATAAQKSQGLGKVKSKSYKELDRVEMGNDYLATKGFMLSEQAKEGKIPVEVLAARFNTSTEIVQLARDNPDIYVTMKNAWGDADLAAQANRWHSPSQIPEALSPVRRTMTLTAKQEQNVGYTGELLRMQRESILGKMNLDTQMKKALNDADTIGQERIRGKVNAIDETLATVNKLWIEASVMAEKSETAAYILHNIIDSGEYKVLRESTGQFVNSRGGNTMTNSSDFVTRNMEVVGTLLTAMSTKLGHYANDATKKFLDPIATEFRKLHTNDAARTEFAIMDNIRQSTPGYVFYDESLKKLMTGVLDAKTGKVSGVAELSQEVSSPMVHAILSASQKAGKEIHATQRVLARLNGGHPPSDIGLWMPSASLRNKEYAYVNNQDNRTQKLLIANSMSELDEAIAVYKLGPNEQILKRVEVDAKAKALNLQDLEQIKAADVTATKRGISSAVPDISPQRLDEIITGYRDRIVAQSSSMVELSSFDLMKKLDYLSDYNKLSQPTKNKTPWMKLADSVTQKNTALDMKDLMLNRNPAYRNEFIQGINSVGDAVLQSAATALSKGFEMAKVGTGKAAVIDYEKYQAAREAAGIPNVFEAFEEAARPKMLQKAREMGIANPNRIIQVGNEIATTFALKFGEIAQPIVNMLSLPIMMTSTISRAIKASNIGSTKDFLEASNMSVMSGGMRRAFATPVMDRGIMKMAESEGLFDPILSEVDAVMKMSKFSSGGPAAAIEKFLDSTFIKIMSKPSELTEAMVRKVAFSTGLETARRIYGPAASDSQVFIFARDFLKQSIGNYSTSQRPMMFQGSVGAAMGLFQTYMLTYAQNLYRHLELKDYKGLGKTMLAQGGIFGAGSLPGFSPISEMIGEHFSDDNFDLTSGTYRALPSELASIIIYGMPSNLGPALHTRGDVAPRVPTGFDTMVAPSMIGQAIGSMVDIGKSIATADANTGQAFFEALSTQSVSRPIARMSELAAGYSVNGAGQKIAGPEDVWSMTGILSRVMSTRPLNETKLRETNYTNSMYGTLDREQRESVIEKARIAIRQGNLTNAMMDDMAVKYMRTGTPQGFRQAMNQAMLENEQSRVEMLRGQFKDSPLSLVIDDLD